MTTLVAIVLSMIRKVYSSVKFWPVVIVLITMVLWTGVTIHVSEQSNLLGCIGAGLILGLITSPFVAFAIGLFVNVCSEIAYRVSLIRLRLH